MKQKINLLIVEHDPSDLRLLLYELKKSSLPVSTEVVRTKTEYEQALINFRPDLILSDYSLPGFDGFSAFQLKQRLSPDTPFIIVSGTLGEEKAVELIKMGVTDYVMKEKMYQVAPKIERAFKESIERKQKKGAEIQLIKREEHLQKILNLSLDLICTLDQEGKFVTLSTASKLILDYLPEELIGTSILGIVHPNDQESVRQAIVNLKYGIDIINREYCFMRKSGASIALLWSVRWDEDDQLGYSIAKDVTDIKKATEKIQNNERRFRTLLQNSTDGLSLLATDGTVLERSSSALKILGLPASEVSGPLRLDRVHPDDLPAITKACAHVKAYPDEILTLQYRYFKPDQGYIWLETSVHNQLREPAVGAIVLNFRDITEQKLAELALEKSEAKYRILFDLSPISMWVCDEDTLHILDVNKAAITHYGFTRKEFLEMRLSDILPAEEAVEFGELVRSFKGTGAVYRDIKRHVKKNGEVIDVEVQCNAIEIGGKEVRMVLAIDVSDRIQQIKAIEEQNVKLREITWMQSHVVRAPLARIMGLTNILTNYGPEEANTSGFINHISDSAHELDEIIREIVEKAEQVNKQPFLQAHAKYRAQEFRR